MGDNWQKRKGCEVSGVTKSRKDHWQKRKGCIVSGTTKNKNSVNGIEGVHLFNGFLFP